MTITDSEIQYLEEVCARARKTRRSLIGAAPTSNAKTAELVLLAYAPSLVRDLKKARAEIVALNIQQRQEPK